MDGMISLLLTFFYNGSLLKVAIKCDANLIGEDDIQYYNESANMKRLLNILPPHITAITTVLVAVEEIFDIGVHE